MDRHEKAMALLSQGTVIPAIPLALTAEQTFDRPRQQRLVRYYLEAGAGGIAAGVHSTQFNIREYGLLKPVLALVAETLERFEKERGTVLIRIAGVCGPIGQACQEAALAKELGYDAVLLSPGGLEGWTEEQLLVRTAAVAEILPVIGFYLQDAVGGRKMSQAYWRQTADIPGVAAIKCACFDRYRPGELVRGVLESGRWNEVALYTGNDDHIVVDLLTPFCHVVDGQLRTKHFIGGLLGQWSVWTRRAVELYHQCVRCRENGQIPTSLLETGERLTWCNRAIFDAGNGFSGCIPGIHYVLFRQGLLAGTWCLDPEETLSPGQAEAIDRVCNSCPDLTDDEFVRTFLRQGS